MIPIFVKSVQIIKSVLNVLKVGKIFQIFAKIVISDIIRIKTIIVKSVNFLVRPANLVVQIAKNVKEIELWTKVFAPTQ